MEGVELAIEVEPDLSALAHQGQVVPGLDRKRPGAAKAVDIVAAIEFHLQATSRVEVQIQRAIHFVTY